MILFEIIGSLLQLGMSLLLWIIKLGLVALIGAVAYFKGRNVWFFMIVSLVVPWPITIIILLLIGYMPRQYPKFPLKIRNLPAFKDKNPVVASIMTLSAMIAKSDGRISKEEIQFVRQFLAEQFEMSIEEINDYREAFEYGKTHSEEYLIFTEVIKGYYAYRRDLIIAVCYLFIGLSMQNSQMPDMKQELTQKILMALGMSAYEYEAIKRYLNGEYEDYAGGSTSFNNVNNEEAQIEKYSQILGVSPNASMSEIKKAYRKLVKEYHPDTVSGMPDEYKAFANQKIREINEAYEYLQKRK